MMHVHFEVTSIFKLQRDSRFYDIYRFYRFNVIVFHRSAYYDSLYANNENQTEIYLNLFNVLKFYYVIRSVLFFKALTRRIRGCEASH